MNKLTLKNVFYGAAITAMLAMTMLATTLSFTLIKASNSTQPAAPHTSLALCSSMSAPEALPNGPTFSTVINTEAEKATIIQTLDAPALVTAETTDPQAVLGLTNDYAMGPFITLVFFSPAHYATNITLFTTQIQAYSVWHSDDMSADQAKTIVKQDTAIATGEYGHDLIVTYNAPSQFISFIGTMCG